MSASAPWLALASDWKDSDMFEGANAGQCLAWIALLCMAKNRGRGGVFTLRYSILCRDYPINNEDLDEMVDRAVRHGAIRLDGNVVTVVNWRTYQDPSKRRTGGSTNGEAFSKKDNTITKTSSTIHHTPNTIHQAPLTKHTLSMCERVYQSYPRKVGKGVAVKSIAKAINRLMEVEGKTDLEAASFLEERTKTFADTPSGRAGRFCPHPSTWFNQERYYDDEQEWRRDAEDRQSIASSRGAAQTRRDGRKQREYPSEDGKAREI